MPNESLLLELLSPYTNDPEEVAEIFTERIEAVLAEMDADGNRDIHKAGRKAQTAIKEALGYDEQESLDRDLVYELVNYVRTEYGNHADIDDGDYIPLEEEGLPFGRHIL